MSHRVDSDRKCFLWHVDRTGLSQDRGRRMTLESRSQKGNVVKGLRNIEEAFCCVSLFLGVLTISCPIPAASLYSEEMSVMDLDSVSQDELKKRVASLISIDD